MRVGIVGGGGAGLATAWLLDLDHEVTLFEGGNRLGGHAWTLEVAAGSGQAVRAVHVEAGTEFLSPALHPTTLRLIRLVRVPVRPSPLTVTLYDTRGGRPLLLPPVRWGRVAWSAFRPRTVAHLLELRRLLRRAPTDAGLDSGAFTVDEALDAARTSDGFRRELFYPLTLSGWCVDLEDFRQFSAHNVLSYLAPSMAPGPPPWVEVEGGMGAYVRAVAASLRRVRVRLSAPVMGVRREAGCYRVGLGDGSTHEVDALVLATNADQARALLRHLPAAAEMRTALAGFRYAATRIAIHGDRRLMPPRRRDWSVVNTRFDGAHSQNTMWKRWREPAGVHVFKSWVTYDSEPPDPLYALITFEHGMIDRAYFHAQRAVAALQGRDGLWLAGVHTAGIDSHESAVVSALRIAERLAPGSARLRALTAGAPGGSGPVRAGIL